MLIQEFLQVEHVFQLEVVSEGPPTIQRNLYESIDYCENLLLGGYSDWKLPNLFEFMSNVSTSGGNGSNSEITINPLFSYINSRYWTSTSHDRNGQPYPIHLEEFKDLAYYISFNYYGSNNLYIVSQGSGNIDFNAKAKAEGKWKSVCIRKY